LAIDLFFPSSALPAGVRSAPSAVRKKQDELLEAYSKWMKSPSPELESQIRGKVAEIKEMDPTFNFPWPPKTPGP